MKNIKLFTLWVLWNYGLALFFFLSFGVFLFLLWDLLTRDRALHYQHITFINPYADKYLTIVIGSRYMTLKVQRQFRKIKMKICKH
jgi:hypothetical protein